MKVTQLKKLVDALKKEGRRQSWLAEKLNMPKKYFYLIVAGDRRISKETAQKISEIMGLDESDLFSADNYQIKPKKREQSNASK